nr:MAG TPA: hypothetical protein [Bacteriophage sp.]
MSCVNYRLSYIVSDLGGYVVCATYFNILIFCTIKTFPLIRGYLCF